ncbi:hypothetical protein [Micromonospora sp. NPDC092111]|uniref:hypothetical protein n=1 Tax=Micromonospora sp. NPDC092111 TaxID=3364289 RepID=UPI0037FC64C5
MSHRLPTAARPVDIDPAVVDPADAADYGDRLHEATHGVACDCRPHVRRQFRRYAEALLCWLTTDGRLTAPSRAER